MGETDSAGRHNRGRFVPACFQCGLFLSLTRSCGLGQSFRMPLTMPKRTLVKLVCIRSTVTGVSLIYRYPRHYWHNLAASTTINGPRMVIFNEAIPPNRGLSKDKVAASSAFQVYSGHQCCLTLRNLLSILIPIWIVISDSNVCIFVYVHAAPFESPFEVHRCCQTGHNHGCKRCDSAR